MFQWNFRKCVRGANTTANSAKGGEKCISNDEPPIVPDQNHFIAWSSVIIDHEDR
ncbi:hypothetical protein [Hyphomicrobium sp. 99]|uniref:hypothetical protein n=1 Tax=Hyphomicrobium sp. 99 TaxID=1163419 RepID=UPI0012DFEB61|nr:hypothetical protein [Hyphomicrobium sp. 99]